MAYTPTVWVTGDVITATKLNKAENGIAAAGVYLVPVSNDPGTDIYTLQASFDDISDAVSDGRLVMSKLDSSETDYTLGFLYAVSFVAAAALPYNVFFFNADGSTQYAAANSTDNLVLQV